MADRRDRIRVARWGRAARLCLATMIALSGAPVLAAEKAGGDSATALVDRHIEAFLRRDWNRMMLDYAADAVFVLPNGPIEGKVAILDFFHSLDAQTPAPTFTASNATGTGDVGLEDWVMNAGRPGSMKGRDVFVIRDGKISVQTTIGVGHVAP